MNTISNALAARVTPPRTTDRYILFEWDEHHDGLTFGGTNDIQGSWPTWIEAAGVANKQRHSWSRRAILDCDKRQLVELGHGELFPEVQPQES